MARTKKQAAARQVKLQNAVIADLRTSASAINIKPVMLLAAACEMHSYVVEASKTAPDAQLPSIVDYPKDQSRSRTLPVPAEVFTALRHGYRALALDDVELTFDQYVEDVAALGIANPGMMGSLIVFSQGQVVHADYNGEDIFSGHLAEDRRNFIIGMLENFDRVARSEMRDVEAGSEATAEADLVLDDELDEEIADVADVEKPDVEKSTAEAKAVTEERSRRRGSARPMRRENLADSVPNAMVSTPLPASLRDRLGDPMRDTFRLLINDFLLHDAQVLQEASVEHVVLPPLEEIEYRAERSPLQLDDNVAPTLDPLLIEMVEAEPDVDKFWHNRGAMVVRVLKYKFAQIDSGERTVEQMEATTKQQLRAMQELRGRSFRPFDSGRGHNPHNAGPVRRGGSAGEPTVETAAGVDFGVAASAYSSTRAERKIMQASAERASAKLQRLLDAKGRHADALGQVIGLDPNMQRNRYLLTIDQAAMAAVEVEKLEATGSKDAVKRSTSAATLHNGAAEREAAARALLVASLPFPPKDDSTPALVAALSDASASRWPVRPTDGKELRLYTAVARLTQELQRESVITPAQPALPDAGRGALL